MKTLQIPITDAEFARNTAPGVVHIEYSLSREAFEKGCINRDDTIRTVIREELERLLVDRSDAKSDLKMSAGTIRLCLQIASFQAGEYDAQQSYSDQHDDKRMFSSAKKIAEAQANACRAMLVQIAANLKDEE